MNRSVKEVLTVAAVTFLSLYIYDILMLPDEFKVTDIGEGELHARPE